MAAESGVAPRAGAWIETIRRWTWRPNRASRPARTRGLKHVLMLLCVGREVSRPARARGLKLRICAEEQMRRMSRPARARGLKQSWHLFPFSILRVAPRAGAWIETQAAGRGQGQPEVAPRAGAWIETLSVIPGTQ